MDFIKRMDFIWMDWSYNSSPGNYPETKPNLIVKLHSEKTIFSTKVSLFPPKSLPVMLEGDDTKDTTQSSGKRVMQSARKRIRPQTATPFRVLEAMAMEQDRKGDEPEKRETEGDEPEQSETEDDEWETFAGRSISLFGRGLGHPVSVIYKDAQLSGAIFPDLDRMLEGLGFDKVDGWKLLTSVAVGGKMTLRGPMFENKPRYDPKTMRKVFMAKERALVSALMFTVFEKQANLSCHMTPPISFKVASEELEFDTSKSYRRTVVVFRADQVRDDLYRVVIEGTTEDLCIHQFLFEPSNTWLIGRYHRSSGLHHEGARTRFQNFEIRPVDLHRCVVQQSNPLHRIMSWPRRDSASWSDAESPPLPPTLAFRIPALPPSPLSHRVVSPLRSSRRHARARARAPA